MDKLGTFKLKHDKKSTLFTLEAFNLYQNQDKKSFKKLADFVYYGISKGEKQVERYKNAFNLYKLDWKLNKDHYSLYSMALMESGGEGVKPDKQQAKKKLKDVIKAGVSGNASPAALVSGAVGLGNIYLEELITKFKF